MKKKDAGVETHLSVLPPIYDLKSTKPFARLSLHSVWQFCTIDFRTSASYVKIGPDSHALLKGVVEFLLYFLYVLTDLGEIRCRRSPPPSPVPLNSSEFGKIQFSGNWILIKGVQFILSIFSTILVPLRYSSVHGMSTTTYRVTGSFMKISSVWEPHCTSGRKWIYVRLVHIHCPIRVTKFGTTDLHTTLMMVRGLREIRHREYAALFL
jgi:hypothetical protein